ncbi:MAG: NosD domain-containing protein [Candidatus Heimdallarchaeota archaeon]
MRKRHVIIISVSVFLITSCLGHFVLPGLLLEEVNPKKDNQFDSFISSQLTQRYFQDNSNRSTDAIIEIVCDQNLSDYGFPGTGTASDPFRIENLSLASLIHEVLFIANTTKYILIRNCTFYARYFAIVFEPLASGAVIIDNCTIRTRDNVGIICHADNVTISNCLFEGNYNGIDYNACLFVQIINNTFLNNHNGVRIEQNASRSVVIGNYFYHNSVGVYFMNAPYNTISGNAFLSNGVGIILTSTSSSPSCSFCVITDNRIENSSSYGIIITSVFEQEFSRENLIFGNSFANNNNSASSQAKDDGLYNMWYNKTAKQGNYWSDWWGVGGYKIDGWAKSYDFYPVAKPLHDLETPVPVFLKGRAIIFSAIAFIILISLAISLLFRARAK